MHNSFLEPYPSSLIKNYLCRNGVHEEVVTLSFAMIVGKYFPFPLVLSNEKIQVQNPRQKWILQEIDHAVI